MGELYAEKFFNDPRVKKAKQLIAEALADVQRKVEGIRPADPDKQVAYAQALHDCAQARGGSLYYPYLGSGFGKGALVELADGSLKYDFISGIGPHYWGHSHPDMMQAGVDAALGDTVMQGNLQQNTDSLKLLQSTVQLARLNGGALEHCFLSTSGAAANENALKIILQKKRPAERILCFEKCFSGRTLALAQMTDKAAYRDGLPVALAVDYVPFYDPEDPTGSTDRAVNRLNQHLGRFPKRHAGMCMELIQGEAGYYPGSHDFFMALIEVLQKHEIAVWVDEIQTFGRTTQPFAFQHFQLDDCVDVVTVGKLSQVCATLFTANYKPGPGLLSQTFTASSSAIAAGNLIMERFLQGDFFGEDGKIERCHQRFVGHLKQLHARFPQAICGPFGTGAMIGFTVFGGDFNQSKAFTDRLFDAGVICFIAGAQPTRVRFLLPIAAIKMQDIDAVGAIIANELERAVAANEREPTKA